MTRVQKQRKEFNDYIDKYQWLSKDIVQYEHYFEIKQNSGNIICTLKDEVILDEMKNEGFMVVISNDLANVSNVFHAYRRKDNLKKLFRC